MLPLFCDNDSLLAFNPSVANLVFTSPPLFRTGFRGLSRADRVLGQLLTLQHGYSLWVSGVPAAAVLLVSAGLLWQGHSAAPGGLRAGQAPGGVNPCCGTKERVR